MRDFNIADLQELRGSATYNPPNLVDGDGATTTVTVTGAALGDFAEASFSLDLQGITLTAWVSAANTVSVRFQNETGGTIDLGSGTLRAKATRPSSSVGLPLLSSTDVVTRTNATISTTSLSLEYTFDAATAITSIIAYNVSATYTNNVIADMKPFTIAWT